MALARSVPVTPGCTGDACVGADTGDGVDCGALAFGAGVMIRIGTPGVGVAVARGTGVATIASTFGVRAGDGAGVGDASAGVGEGLAPGDGCSDGRVDARGADGATVAVGADVGDADGDVAATVVGAGPPRPKKCARTLPSSNPAKTTTRISGKIGMPPPPPLPRGSSGSMRLRRGESFTIASICRRCRPRVRPATHRRALRAAPQKVPTRPSTGRRSRVHTRAVRRRRAHRRARSARAR